jgi:hypothetical protein
MSLFKGFTGCFDALKMLDGVPAKRKDPEALKALKFANK